MSLATGFCIFDTAIGPCGLAWGPRGVVGAQLPAGNRDGTLRRMQQRFPQAPETQPPPLMNSVVMRVQSLLGGYKDPLLDVALDMAHVHAFNQRVYKIARAIPVGRTMTYGEVAEALGEPNAARAVGQALGQNPFAPIVPCHRVLGAGNAGTGFSATGGVDTKLRMLQIENAQLGAEPGLF